MTQDSLESKTLSDLRSHMENLLFFLNIYISQYISKGLEMLKGLEISNELEIALESKTVLALLSLIQKSFFSLNIFRSQDMFRRIEISKRLEIQKRIEIALEWKTFSAFEIPKGFDIALEFKKVPFLHSLMEKLLFLLTFPGIKIFLQDSKSQRDSKSQKDSRLL